MRVRMKQTVSGTRNGVDWPPVGGIIDVPESEAESLIAIGIAAKAEPPEENAAAPATEEKAVPPAKPSTPRKPAPKPAK